MVELIFFSNFSSISVKKIQSSDFRGQNQDFIGVQLYKIVHFIAKNVNRFGYNYEFEFFFAK